jgi:FAD/FMN-containing dehydrogenase
VAWQLEQLDSEWRAAGAPASTVWRGDDAHGWLRELAEFPQAAPAPLVAQATVRPSGTVPLFRAFQSVDPRVSLLAHAGNGIVIARFSEFPAGGLARTLVGRVHPAALRYDGAVKILANPGGQEMAPHTVWGAGGAQLDVMMSVKRQFDPRHVLNPGRFVFPAN